MTTNTRYHGGQEGGPLVLFEASGSTAVRPALVMSPATDFNDAVLGLAPDVPGPPQCTSPIPPKGQCELFVNVDFEGHDILPPRRNVTTPAACCDACHTEPQCTCFSWLNTPGYENYCALKTSTAGRTSISGHVSGVRCDLPPTPQPSAAAPEGLSGGLHGHLHEVPGNTTVSFVIAAR